ncbi:hypothetical protein [Novosphingobium sp. ST904]|uniref:hypothetical protein n=1 Tax=Novosphingobium sp. ST904 TaxID=1684385 RepID=UPI0006C8CCD4|nr:hypothetical protein [Novosphingobium sp. ST904]
MKFTSLAAIAAAMTAASPVLAAEQAVSSAVVAAQPALSVAPAGSLTLPANSELTVTPNSEVSSKSMREGDVFTITTSTT